MRSKYSFECSLFFDDSDKVIKFKKECKKNIMSMIIADLDSRGMLTGVGENEYSVYDHDTAKLISLKFLEDVPQVEFNQLLSIGKTKIKNMKERLI